MFLFYQAANKPGILSEKGSEAPLCWKHKPLKFVADTLAVLWSSAWIFIYSLTSLAGSNSVVTLASTELV